MTDADFAYVAKLLRDRTAVVLEPGKEYLLVSRLTPVAERHGLVRPSNPSIWYEAGARTASAT